MRFLPDKPSLSFLRQEAKDLLDALRESDPTASLTKAQHALAAQYGWRDWAELRSEAARRAQEVPTPPAGLAEAIAAAFDLGRVLAVAPVSFTPMGRSWSLTTDRGRWRAVSVYPWITDHQAELGARLRDAAIAEGVVAPTSRRSRHGRLIETVLGDQSWRVHEWMDFGPVPVSPTPAIVAGQIGRTYGILHSLAIPHDAPIHPFLISPRPADDWEKLIARAYAAKRPWITEFEQLLPDMLELASIEIQVHPDQVILCNANLIPEHVHTGHNDTLVITEWDFAGSLTPRLELGSALMHWTILPLINTGAAQAFRDGYVQSFGEWPELRVEDFAVACTGWLNWMYNTTCEAIDPEDTDRDANAQREMAELMARPLTRPSLEKMIAILA